MKGMKRFGMGMAAAAAIFAGANSIEAGEVLNGAGATFPYPIYAKWSYVYNKQFHVKLNYQSIGSGGGIKQIVAKTVDFGASDAPLKPAKLKKYGLIQFPMIMGGVVPVVNIKGVESGKIKLSAANLADIYLGKITNWNDKRLLADNPGLVLPDKGITVVHRADGSGTTWIFTNYLCKVSRNWKKRVGNAKAVQWPAGMGGKGNEGVASFVRSVKGSIGYVEYAYALQNKMTTVSLKNHDGNYVNPTSESFQAAAAGADWKHAEGYYMVLTNQPGAKSWPITGASFILMYKRQQNVKTSKAVLNFFDWCYKHGAQAALSLHYVPMPDEVVKLVEKSWRDDIKGVNGSDCF